MQWSPEETVFSIFFRIENVMSSYMAGKSNTKLIMTTDCEVSTDTMIELVSECACECMGGGRRNEKASE